MLFIGHNLSIQSPSSVDSVKHVEVNIVDGLLVIR
jgi:hypothetical protein